MLQHKLASSSHYNQLNLNILESFNSLYHLILTSFISWPHNPARTYCNHPVSFICLYIYIYIYIYIHFVSSSNIFTIWIIIYHVVHLFSFCLYYINVPVKCFDCLTIIVIAVNAIRQEKCAFLS